MISKLVPKTVTFYRCWYKLLKFWYLDRQPSYFGLDELICLLRPLWLICLLYPRTTPPSLFSNEYLITLPWIWLPQQI